MKSIQILFIILLFLILFSCSVGRTLAEEIFGPDDNLNSLVAAPEKLAFKLTKTFGQPNETAVVSVHPKKANATFNDRVLIPAGEFEMGSHDGDEREKPVHTVFLNAYYIDKYEVTVADYRQCVKNGKCKTPISG
jgi:formylglycine-generating enzyme required for sulfatase activity